MAICLALALSACSSKNGGSSAPAPKPVVPSQGSKPTTQPTTTNTTTSSNSVKTTYVGQAINTANGSQKNINTNNVATLIVDGKTYTIESPNISAGSFVSISSKDFQKVVSGRHMNYAKYGSYKDIAGTGNEYVFYQGQQTAANKVPSTGMATYQGRSTLVCGSCADNRDINGTSQFTVDFGNKSITGSLTHPNTTVNLAATINGNSFTGAKDGFTTTGGFFGPNAEEISGVFTNQSQKISGAFGATKQ